MAQEKQSQLDIDLDAIRDFCEAHPIEQLALFGSVLRDDFTETSDVDILVAYHPDAILLRY